MGFILTFLSSLVLMDLLIEKYRVHKNWNLGRLLKIIQEQSDQVDFLQALDILPREQVCEVCSKIKGCEVKATNIVIPDSHYVHFRCKCQARISIRKNSFFYKSHISFRRFILLAYSFTAWTWTYSQTAQVCVFCLKMNFLMPGS